MLKDEALKLETDLPNAAGGTVVTEALQLKSGIDPQGGWYRDMELVVEVPALSAAILPKDATLQLSVETADTNDETGWTSATNREIATLVGDTSGGLVAQTLRYAFPSDVRTWFRVRVTLGTTATDASSLTLTAWLVF